VAERIIALTEGHLDRVIVERMLKGHDPDVYPKREVRQQGGKDAALAEAAAALRAGVARVVLALDLNGSDEGQLTSKVQRALGNVRSEAGRRNAFLFGEGTSPSRVCLWPVGFRSDPVLQALGITSHSAEDLIIKALHVPECLAKVAAMEPGLKIPRDPWGVVSEMLLIARTKGAEVKSAKDLLRVFLALIGFGAALATVGGRVIGCAEGTDAQAIFERPPEFELP